MILRTAKFIVLICLLSYLRVGVHAQTPVSPSTLPQPPASEADPEDAFLSSTKYTNIFFGFEFGFPPQAGLKPIPTTSPLDRRTELLEMLGPAPQHALVSICAFEYKGKNWTDAKGILRRDLDQELFTGVEELHGLSKATIDGHQFYYFETRKALAQHVELATELNGYVVLALLQATDPKMVKDLTSAFYHVKFFSPQEVKRHIEPDAVAYEGPAVSSQRLRELKAAPPAERMDPGKVKGNVYRNTQIGFLYEFPQGWSVQSQGAVEPAVERYREKVLDQPGMGPRERDVVKACRRTLLSAWKSTPGADGQVRYEDFGEVTLSAMPLSCFPNIRFPDNPKDADAVRRFLMGYSLTQPIQRDMRDARSFEAGGKTFVLTSGTIAYKDDGDSLSRRISVATALTQHRGYLLVWLFAAPHDAELRDLMNAKVGFDPDSANQKDSANRPGGGEAAPESQKTSKTLQTTASETATTDGDAANKSVPNSTETDGVSSDGGSAASTATSSKPTLLRDGETMQSQQMQGAPIPRQQTQPH